jgi:diacylglycerol kinase family enzyme
MNMSQIAIVANPVSGSGRSRTVAKTLEEELMKAGLDTRLIWTEPRDSATWLDAAAEGASVMLVVGGDGTVRLVADGAERMGIPLWQVPCGTENLLARSLGMSADVSTILTAIDRGQVARLDLARANGTPCLLMATCGFDAAVVHDLAGRRGKTIRHWNYLPCMFRQFVRWSPVNMTLELDGSTVRRDVPGWCFICNCKEYGARFNPAPDADMTDGLLDVLFLPTGTRWQLLQWMHRVRRGRYLGSRGVLFARAKHVRLQIEPAAAWQVDGDRPPEQAIPVSDHLEVICHSAKLPILLPG